MPPYQMKENTMQTAELQVECFGCGRREVNPAIDPACLAESRELELDLLNHDYSACPDCQANLPYPWDYTRGTWILGWVLN
jgi:hypothetical protein